MSTRIRGLPVEVALGLEDGMPRACAVNLDTITTVAKAGIRYLAQPRRDALDDAVRFALGLDEQA